MILRRIAFFHICFNHKREHFLKSSYGQLKLDSFVTDWVTIDFSEAYCADGQQGTSVVIQTCLKNALSKIDPVINFTDFDVDGDRMIDAIGFFHSGYGAEFGSYDMYNTYMGNRIWSHKWEFYRGKWTSAEGVSVYNYHINPSIVGLIGSAIGRIGTCTHETGHL
jgi:M6 family metalloprotease-like protein